MQTRWKVVFCALAVPIAIWAVMFITYAVQATPQVMPAGVDPATAQDTAHVWLFGVDVGWPTPSVAMADLSPLANYTIQQLPLIVLMQVRTKVHYDVHPQYCAAEWADREVEAADSSVAVLDRAIVTYQVGNTFGMPVTAPVMDFWAPGDPGSWEYYNPWR